LLPPIRSPAAWRRNWAPQVVTRMLEESAACKEDGWRLSWRDGRVHTSTNPSPAHRPDPPLSTPLLTMGKASLLRIPLCPQARCWERSGTSGNLRSSMLFAFCDRVLLRSPSCSIRAPSENLALPFLNSVPAFFAVFSRRGVGNPVLSFCLKRCTC
jgi:hypothetical protein